MTIVFKYRFEDEILEFLEENNLQFNELGAEGTLLSIEIIDPTFFEIEKIKELPLNSYKF